MTYEDVAGILENFLSGQWISTPIVYDNTSVNLVDRAPWVRFTIQPSTTDNQSIGTDKTIKDGFAVLQIFTPLDTGSREAIRLADEFLALVENREFLAILSQGTLFTYAGEYIRLGDDGNGWYAINATVPFQAT